MPPDQVEGAGDELEGLQDAPEEESEESQPAELVRYRLNGKTLMLTEEQIRVIEEHEAQRQQVIGRMGTELGTLRQQVRQQQPVSRDPAEDDIEWLSSPSKREARLRQELHEEIRQEMTAQVQYNEWWNRFYEGNQDLRLNRDAVDFIRYRDMQELGQLDERTCHRELANRVRSLLGTSETRGRPLSNRQVQSERTSNASPRPRETEDDTPQPRRMGAFQSALSQMQAKRRAAYWNAQGAHNSPKEKD